MSTNAYFKAGRLVFVLTLLAWATDFVWAQVARGAEVLADDSAVGVSEEKFAQGGGAAERQETKFTPGTRRFLAGATLELRGEATIVGGDVKLRQICRWSEADKPAFEPVADLVVSRVGAGTAFRAVTAKELKSILSDAGVNLAVVRFAGATHCTITRSDATGDERASLQEWVEARQGVGASTQPSTAPVLASAKPRAAQMAAMVEGPAKSGESRTLRELLVADLADRLSIDAASVQMFFSPADERLLRLSEPLFRFNVDGQRIRNLGDVTWEVTILGDGGKAMSQKTLVHAKAKAWRQLLLARVPIAFHQEFRDADLVEQRTLVDQLETDTPVKRDQAVGQMAARELRVGTVMTARLVDPMPLAKVGDLITVTITQGAIQVTTVARATESGSYGQTIHARHEGDSATYDVTLTGPKAGRMMPVTAAPEKAVATVTE